MCGGTDDQSLNKGKILREALPSKCHPTVKNDLHQRGCKIKKEVVKSPKSGDRMLHPAKLKNILF